MTKAEKEERILNYIHNLEGLDNVGCYGYLYISFLVDIIAEVAFGCQHTHDFHGETIYPEDIIEYNILMSKISTVIGNMANKGVIKLSKSRKMFKLV